MSPIKAINSMNTQSIGLSPNSKGKNGIVSLNGQNGVVSLKDRKV